MFGKSPTALDRVSELCEAQDAAVMCYMPLFSNPPDRRSVLRPV